MSKSSISTEAGSAAPDEQRQPDVSVVLPTFNEKQNIVPLVEELRTLLRERGLVYEILVVDDNSPDGTGAAVAEAFGDDAGVRLLTRTRNPGLALSIRHGLEQCTGAVAVVMDTDFNHRPVDAVLLAEIGRSVDLAVGSRFIFGGGMTNKFRYRTSFLYNIFLRYTLGTRLDENLSGLFAIRRGALAELDFDKIFWGFGDYFFRLLLLSQRAGLLHVEVPVRYGDRLTGESKTRVWKMLVDYTWEVGRLLAWKARGRW